MQCGAEIGRHSKSIDTKAQRCGRCRGSLQLLQPSTTATAATPTPRKPSAFAQFVAEQYGRVKQELRDAGGPSAHGDVMRDLASRWRTRTTVV